jgi:hypothetical protein
MLHRDQYNTALVYAGGVVLAIYAMIMVAGYAFFAQYTSIPVSINIGRDFYGQNLPDGALLRLIAAVGIICNIQVTCPLLTFPIRDIVAAVATSLYHRPAGVLGGMFESSETHADSNIGLELTATGKQPTLYKAAVTEDDTPVPGKSTHLTPTQFTLTMSTVSTLFLVFLFALLLRNYFANICSIIGSLVTMVNSLLLPLAFFHKLSNKKSSTARVVLHTCIALLALSTAFVGAGGNFCVIFHSTAGVCQFISPQ